MYTDNGSLTASQMAMIVQRLGRAKRSCTTVHIWKRHDDWSRKRGWLGF
jgi:hypothetical protein